MRKKVTINPFTFSRQSELYEADTRVIKLRKRVARIKELFEGMNYQGSYY